MTPDSPRVALGRLSMALGPVAPRRRKSILGGALVVLCLTAAACGGGDGADRSASVETQLAGSEASPVQAAPAGDFISTRPGDGIAAVGGNPQAVRSDNPCERPADAAHEPVTIAYVGANLAELEAVGLETIVVEEPGVIIAAYVDEMNLNGGANGRCVEFVPYLWSLTDPVASFGRLCMELPQQQPLIVLSLGLSQTTFECITLAAQLPTLGLYATKSDAQFAAARGRLFVDQGSEEHLLLTGVSVALQAGELMPDDRVGLFNVSSGTTALAAERAGLTVADTAIVPPAFADLQLLGIERQARLLEDGLSDTELRAARLFREQLPPDQAEILQRIEQHFLEIADRFRSSEVTTVVAAAQWSDVRRLMRAAEQRGWFPRWIINDSQPASLVLTNAPRGQADNLVQISARRAAGDEIPAIDRGCLSLRNANSETATFSHRFHSDAWNLLISMCDYLDVVFGAISRVDGPLTHEAFVEALANTHYETALGSLVKFGRTDRFGNDRFRILRADPNCVLNSWGCMRSTTDWLTPTTAVSK